MEPTIVSEEELREDEDPTRLSGKDITDDPSRGPGNLTFPKASGSPEGRILVQVSVFISSIA